MYIHWNIEEETIKNIITSLSSELGLERYRKEDALERLKDTEEKLKTAREKISEYENEAKHQDDVDGLHCVIDDLIQQSNEKDAQIKTLTDKNTALQETIHAMSERLAMYNPVADKKNGYDAAYEASDRATDAYTDVQG